MEKQIINVEDFFTSNNEKDGMWFEPVIEGNPCGIEFLLIGIHSDEAVANMEHYDRLSKELKTEKDPKIRAQKEAELDAERVASITKGIRGAGGAELRKDGKPIDFSIPFIKEFYLQSPLIKMANIEFAVKTANFMKRKKIG